MIRLMLVEDHTSFREALEAMFGLEADLHVVVSAGDGTTALGRIDEEIPDVAIVDLDLPGQGGVEFVRDVRARVPGVRCVVLSALRDPVELGRAVEAGAAAVLHKTLSVADVIKVVREVAAGRTVLDSDTVSTWLGALGREREERWAGRLVQDSLTPREHEILRRLARGEASSMIAADLVISEATVSTHIRNLRAKLGASTRLEAVTEALRLRLLEPPRGS